MEFYKKLPVMIQDDDDLLGNYQDKFVKLEKSWKEKINQTNQELSAKWKLLTNWKLWHIFGYLTHYFKLKNQESILMPNDFNENLDKQKQVLSRIENYKKNPERIFQDSESLLIKNLNHLDEIQKTPHFFGAEGELRVLEELKKLDDSFNIFCDVNISSDDWITYRGEKNLGSAQLDFLIVSNKGIFVVEVKNWTRDYISSHRGLSPYEQLDRSGRLMYTFLKNFFNKPKVNKILVNLKDKFEYNQDYKSVIPISFPGLVSYILRKKKTLEDNNVERIKNMILPNNFISI
jgi:hypothetical protein